MEMSNITEYLVPIIIIACLIVGYVVKHTPILKPIANDYIPIIVAVLGAILGGVINNGTMEGVIYGALSGLASTGLHQAFIKVLGLKD